MFAVPKWARKAFSSGKVRRVLQRQVHLARKTNSVNETGQPIVGGTWADMDRRTVRLRGELNICPFEPVPRHKDRIWAPLDFLPNPVALMEGVTV